MAWYVLKEGNKFTALKITIALYLLINFILKSSIESNSYLLIGKEYIYFITCEPKTSVGLFHLGVCKKSFRLPQRWIHVISTWKEVKESNPRGWNVNTRFWIHVTIPSWIHVSSTKIPLWDVKRLIVWGDTCTHGIRWHVSYCHKFMCCLKGTQSYLKL